MATKDKSMWILIVFILAGVVIGGLVGDLASKSTVYGGLHMVNNLV